MDYHGNKYTDELAHGDGSIYNQASWTTTWVQLVDTIIKSVPQAAGKLLIDLINEPDKYVPTKCPGNPHDACTHLMYALKLCQGAASASI